MVYFLRVPVLVEDLNSVSRTYIYALVVCRWIEDAFETEMSQQKYNDH